MEQEEAVAKFQEIAGVSESEARFFLDSYSWDLELAISNYCTMDGDNENVTESSEGTSAVTSGKKVTSKGSASSGRELDEELISDDDEPFLNTTSDPYKINKVPTAKITSMSALRAAQEAKNADSDEDQDGQAFYAGGSITSGQQVLGPPGKQKAIFNYLVKTSKKQQQSGHTTPVLTQDRVSSHFSGKGYRLGQTEDDTTVIEAAPTPTAPRNVTLTMYENGFTVNHGSLRSYSDLDHEEFADRLRSGEMPPGILSPEESSGNGLVHLAVEDKRNEKYSSPKKLVQAFSGKGHLLGSPAPSISTTKSPVPESSTGNNSENESLAKNQLNLNESLPQTSVQVRLPDGSRLQTRMNHNHTVGDLRQFIRTARPQFVPLNFMLMSTFPSKVLDDSQNLEQADILNSVVTLRLQ